ncbi:hypothetical protein [Streptomyces sp. NPDC018693]|uniref:hypothetical protein n=1 Tax=unclassified Streptomyces TaxID=2593676 RepID=UPI0037951B9F
MWLWQDIDHFAFNVSERIRGSEDFRNEAQFASVAADLALRAERQVEKCRHQFPDLQAAANYLMAQPVRPGWFWEPWNAGVAAGLVGDASTARDRFAAVLAEDPIAPWMHDAQETTRELLDLVGNRDAVRSWAMNRIASCRERLDLDVRDDLNMALGCKP